MTTPHAEAEANQLAASNPGRIGVRRRLGRVRQDAAADRPAAAADGGRREAGAHPVPHLHQSRRGRNGAATATPSRRVGHAAGAGAVRANCASSHIEPTEATHPPRARRCSPRCWICRAACGSAQFMRFANRCCGGFRLEAEISPHFQLAEDRDADEAMTDAREDLLASVRPRGASNAASDLEVALRALAGAATLDRFSKLVTGTETRSRALATGARGRPGPGGGPAASVGCDGARSECRYRQRGRRRRRTRVARGGAR